MAQLTTGEVGALVGVTPATIRQHLQRGTMPPPDGYLGRTPWWWSATIDAWLTTRSKRGRPTGLRAAAGYFDDRDVCAYLSDAADALEVAERRVKMLEAGLRFIVAKAEPCTPVTVGVLKCDARIIAARLLEGVAFADPKTSADSQHGTQAERT